MGFIESLYMVNVLHDQPEKIEKGQYGSFLFKLLLESDLSTREYIQRPIWLANYAPGFQIPGKRGRKMTKTDSVISLPMYAKYSRLNLDQIPMTRLLLNMHEPDNHDHIKHLKDSLVKILE